MEAPDSVVVDSAALDTSGSASFGQIHFGACVLGDKRLVKRAIQSANAILSRPGGTLPAKLHDAQLTGFYDPSASSGEVLMDRGGDTFESLDRQQRLEQSFVVRSRTNRTVRVRDKAGRMICRKRHDWARKLPSMGRREVEVAGNHQQQARTAKVWVSAGPVELQVPKIKYGARHDDTLPATEGVAPEDVEALSLSRWKEARPDLSARQFLAELGRMGRQGNRICPYLWCRLSACISAICVFCRAKAG